MIELGIIEKIVTLGLGAVIAIIVLYWKKIDDVAYQANLKVFLEESLKREHKMVDIVQLQTITLETLKATISNLDIYIRISDKLK